MQVPGNTLHKTPKQQNCSFSRIQNFRRNVQQPQRWLQNLSCLLKSRGNSLTTLEINYCTKLATNTLSIHGHRLKWRNQKSTFNFLSFGTPNREVGNNPLINCQKSYHNLQQVFLCFPPLLSVNRPPPTKFLKIWGKKPSGKRDSLNLPLAITTPMCVHNFQWTIRLKTEKEG